jgi:outer membrane protein OmpA-like peptidoglycan-associated protein
MKHILARAPAVAALFIVACAGSQKNLTEPQKAALKAEEVAQDAQNDAQKARQDEAKKQAELYEAQTTHAQARQEEIAADQKAQQASYAASRAEQQAGMASRTQAQAQQAQQAGAGQKGVAEAQGPTRETTKLVVITSGLLFPTNSAELSSAAKPKLDEVASTLKQNPQGGNVIVEGFTDDTGSKEFNQKLSEERAQAVSDYLQSQGIPKDRVQTKAMGEQSPVASEKTAEGRALNRRVDIMVQPSQGQTNMQGQEKQQQGQEKQQQQQQQQQQGQKPQPNQ